MIGSSNWWCHYALPMAALGLLLALAGVCSAAEAPRQSLPEPTPPRYELRCTSDEFAILQQAISAGLAGRGGDVYFQARVKKSPTGVDWLLTVPSASVLDAWGDWLSDRMADIVSSLDLDKPSEQAKKDVLAAKAAKVKLDQARANPVYDPVAWAGEVDAKDGVVSLKYNLLAFKLVGGKAAGVAALVGKRVVIAGYMKTKGEIEVTGFSLQRPNTLDLFVMSLCPYGKAAETALIKFLSSSSFPAESKPKLDIHYIIYKKQDGDKTYFTSLHGEEEVVEDLVQIVIRDEYPTHLWNYLLKRAQSADSWDKVAADSGIDQAGIDLVRTKVTTNRDALIENEFNYGQDRQVTDGSPTYLWEGIRTRNPEQIQAFNGLSLGKQSCGGTGH